MLYYNSPENKAAWVQEWKAKTEASLSSHRWKFGHKITQ